MTSNLKLNTKFLLERKVRIVTSKRGSFIYLMSTSKVLLANEIALKILELCDGKHSVNDMLVLLRSVYPEVSVATLKADLSKFLDKLQRLGVITT